jgi:hypothetical protein
MQETLTSEVNGGVIITFDFETMKDILDYIVTTATSSTSLYHKVAKASSIGADSTLLDKSIHDCAGS